MMAHAMLLMPRPMATPPLQLVAVLPLHASVRRFTAPGVGGSEDCGKPGCSAEQLLGAMNNAPARGGMVQMCSVTRETDRERVLAAVQQDGWALRFASAEVQADREVVLAAVRQSGWAFQFASAEPKADREVVLAAVQQFGRSLGSASTELQADREVVLAAVRQDGRALGYASAELKTDREVMLAAVRQDGLALGHAFAELTADREVVLAAVQQDGRALEHASAKLKADREVVLAAVHQNPGAFCYASTELQEDGAVLNASNHVFVRLERLPDHGQLKVLRTLASVRECGIKMDNCLAWTIGLAEFSRQTFVKLDGDDGTPLAVGSFANGEWGEIRYKRNQDAKGGGNRACGRGTSTTALPAPENEDALQQFEAFLPALRAFEDKM